MAIFRWHDRSSLFNPFAEVQRLQREMNRMFSDLSTRPAGLSRPAVFPPVNVSENDNGLHVRAELPGVSPDAIEVSVDGEALTLRGERKLEAAAEGINYHRRERESGRFRRIITLPYPINPDGVEAAFSNGVLKIVLPKAEQARPRQIPVKA